ncbi:MAG: 2-C-methyl-D-erythritol 2,4-cyclodiphosphate synthase [Corynebacterium sp.]|nr:2-C-methyl-D-erythritol 2,4-cyclodiphosphate synthase [Corynebacterium sp.]
MSKPLIPRIGQGVDAHRIDPDKPCWIACTEFPGVPGCEGHSDGDVVAHALTDALLTAAGLGDLGSFIGTERPEYRGASGARILTEAVNFLHEHGYAIGNASAQLVATTPRFGAHRAAAEETMGKILGAPVSLSATTTDGLGFTGTGEGRAAIATALVYAIIENHE